MVEIQDAANISDTVFDKSFWKNLIRDMKMSPPDFTKVLQVLTAIIKIAGPNLEFVENRLLATSQLIDSGRCDRNELIALVSMIIQSIQTHIKPAFDSKTTDFFKKAVTILAESDVSEQPRALCNAIQTLYHKVCESREAIKSVATTREEGFQLFLSGSLAMKDSDFRKARELLEKSLTTFFVYNDERLLSMVQSKLRQLDSVELHESARNMIFADCGKIITSPSTNEDQIFLEKLAELQEQADEITCKERIRTSTDSSGFVGRSETENFIFDAQKPNRDREAATYSETNDTFQKNSSNNFIDTGPKSIVSEEAAQLLRLHTEAEELFNVAFLQVDESQLLDAKLNFERSADLYRAAGFDDLAVESQEQADSVAYTIQVLTEVACFHANRECLEADDWDCTAYSAAKDTFQGVAATYGCLGLHEWEAKYQQRSKVMDLIVQGQTAHCQAEVLLQSGRLLAADQAFQKAQELLDAALCEESAHWLEKLKVT